MRKINKGTVVKIMSMGLAVAIAAGSIVTYNVKSNASELLQTDVVETTDTDEVISIENYEDFEKKLEVIKAKYNVEETIKTLEEFQSKIKEDITGDNIEYIIAQTSKNVVLEFLYKEQENFANVLNESSEKINAVMNEECAKDENMEIRANDEGDYVVTLKDVNEYGSETTVTISDFAVNRERKFDLIKRHNGKNVTVAFGDRSHTYTYTLKMLKVCELRISFKVTYNVSKNGLKLGTISDAGTKTTYPLSTCKIYQKDYDDKVATHVGANIDGTVWAKFACLPGAEFGGIKFPSGTSCLFKINFWITLNSLNTTAKKAGVSHSHTVYQDDPSLLS